MNQHARAAYQQAIADRDLTALFCDRYLPRMVPGADPARVWARASQYAAADALPLSRLAQLCATDPDAVRKYLSA